MHRRLQVIGAVMTVSAVQHLTLPENLANRTAVRPGLERLNRSAVPFDEMLARDPFGPPTAQMSQEPRRNRHDGLTLLGCASSERQAMENSLFQIDE
jgi:hypothetical protein